MKRAYGDERAFLEMKGSDSFHLDIPKNNNGQFQKCKVDCSI